MINLTFFSTILFKMKMLRYNPNERITSSEALKHPYFSGKPICAINISSLFPKDDWVKLTHDALVDNLSVM